MHNPLIEQTTRRLQFLARSPVASPTADDLDEWRHSEPPRYDEELISAFARQLRLEEHDYDRVWSYVGRPLCFHLETVVKSPSREMFSHHATLIGQEAMAGLDGPELVELFVAAGWQDYTPKVPVRDFAAAFGPEGERRVAKRVERMLTRWDDRGYWSESWRKRPRQIDLTEREERRAARLAGEQPFNPPHVPDASRD